MATHQSLHCEYLPVVPLIRVYFNKHGDKPWSVDFGVGTKEYTVKQIFLYSVFGHTIYAPDKGDDLNTPTAFLTIKNSSFYYFKDLDKIHIGSN